MKYLSAGQISLDKTTFPDGRVDGPYQGGTAMFGYGGIRVWDDDCAPVANIATDFYDYFGDWIRENNICCDYLKEVYEKTHLTNLVYEESGKYENRKTLQEKIDSAYLYGLSNCRPEQIGAAAKGAKGVYLYLEPKILPFWKELARIRRETPFAIMWEPGFSDCAAQMCPQLLEIWRILRPEMSSLNQFEAGALFGTTEEEEIFRQIEALEIPYFFYRAGKKGAWALAGGERWFVPSIDVRPGGPVDPTGCGNTTTAAAMVGWLETHNPVMATIMANISGGYNVLQKGMIPRFDPQQRAQAIGLAVQHYDAFVQQHPEYPRLGYASSGAEIFNKALSAQGGIL